MPSLVVGAHVSEVVEVDAMSYTMLVIVDFRVLGEGCDEHTCGRICPAP